MAAPSPDGVVLLTQPVHHPIDESTARASLRDDLRSLPYRGLVAPVQVAMADVGELPWPDARRATERFWRDELLPLLRGNPRWTVAYFGAAPIPLAMLLGHLIGSWRDVEVHQQHHLTRDWAWPPTAPPRPPTVVVTPHGLPQELVPAAGDAVIRVTTWHRIDPEATRALVPAPLADIDITLDRPGADALATPADVEAVARAVEAALDAVMTLRPGVRTVHLFAAVPVGLAFRIGTLISPTKHPNVQTWQYDRNAATPYRRAIALHDESPTLTAPSADDRAAADALRATWRDELQRLGDFGQTLAEREPNAPWTEQLFPHLTEVTEAFGNGWKKLPTLVKAALHETTLDARREALDGGFEFDPDARVWRFDDALLARIASRVAADGARRQAGRMFLLHEAVHLVAHGLTTATSRRVGRFPKVVEEIDHQADVWAAFHDYAFARHHDRGGTNDAPAWFRALIDGMLGTFWAFDDEGHDLQRIQVRRLNRYLLWYWRRLQLERARSLADVARCFAERPWIELAGLPLSVTEERVLYTLAPHATEPLELAVLVEHRLCRVGVTQAHPLGDLAAGFRERDGAKIQRVLRGAFDSVAPTR